MAKRTLQSQPTQRSHIRRGGYRHFIPRNRTFGVPAISKKPPAGRGAQRDFEAASAREGPAALTGGHNWAATGLPTGAALARAGVFLCSLTFVAGLVGGRQRFDHRPAPTSPRPRAEHRNRGTASASPPLGGGRLCGNVGYGVFLNPRPLSHKRRGSDEGRERLARKNGVGSRRVWPSTTTRALSVASTRTAWPSITSRALSVASTRTNGAEVMEPCSRLCIVLRTLLPISESASRLRAAS